MEGRLENFFGRRGEGSEVLRMWEGVLWESQSEVLGREKDNHKRFILYMKEKGYQY